MSRWICPRCDREFDRANQSHTCAPGNDIAETFVGFPDGHRAACEAIVGYLRTLGPLHVDAVRVGVFLKTQRKLAEVRPKTRWVSLELVLPTTLRSPRVTRTAQLSAERIVHWIRLVRPEDVDGELEQWLRLAYDAATD
jgi:hypothetical protein